MAVALIAAGGLGGAVLYNSTGQRIAVLALARDVPMGQALTADDLVVARIAGDPALRPLDARDRTRTIGLRATTDLRRGALLLNADVTSTPVVEPGQVTVGLAAKRTQLPATRLQPGLRVIVVSTPDSSGASGQGGSTRTPETLAATSWPRARATPPPPARPPPSRPSPRRAVQPGVATDGGRRGGGWPRRTRRHHLGAGPAAGLAPAARPAHPAGRV